MMLRGLPTPQPAALGLAALLLWVFWVGVHHAPQDLPFTDEVLSRLVSGAPPYGPLAPQAIVQRIVEVEAGSGMGMMYYVPLGLWAHVAGGSYFALRLYSVLFAVLAVAALYRLAADMLGRQAGWWAALALGTAAFFLYHAHEARTYTAYTCFAVLSVWCYWRATQRTHVGWCAALFLAQTALNYMHYVSLAVLAVLLLAHTLGFRRTQAWGLVLLALLASGAAYLPWLPMVFAVVGAGSAYSRADTSLAYWQIPVETLQSFANGSLGLLLALACFAWGMPRRARVLVVAWLAMGVGLVMLVSARIPFVVSLRYLLFLFPALALVVAAGAQALARRGVPAWALMSVWALVGIGQTLNPHFMATQHGQVYRAPAAGMQAAHEVLRQRAQPDDAFLYHFLPAGLEPFGLFVMGDLAHGIPHARLEQFGLVGLSQEQADNPYEQAVNATLGAVRDVWTLVVPQVPTDNNFGVVRYVLETQFAHCQRLLDRADMQMDYYVRDPATPSDIILRRGADVAAVYLHRVTAAPVLRATVHLDAASLPPGTYSLALHLRDASGMTVRQQDLPVPDERPIACQTLEVPYDGLPAGDYDAVLYIYDWRTGAQLSADGSAAVPVMSLRAVCDRCD
jgi:hypothetical protein